MFRAKKKNINLLQRNHRESSGYLINPHASIVSDIKHPTLENIEEELYRGIKYHLVTVGTSYIYSPITLTWKI